MSTCETSIKGNVFLFTFANVFYLSDCYSIARDRLQNHLRLSVSLSVNTPTAAILIRFWWNFHSDSGPKK